MRMRIALVLLALALGASGCGGSAEGTDPAERTVATVPSTGSSRSASQRRGASETIRASRDDTSCVARGIVVPPFNEGTCVQNGRRFVIVNGRSVLRLTTLSAAIQNFSVAEAIPGRGSRATPQGAFIIIGVRVTNRTRSPQRFGPGQTLLTIREQQFEERTDVEGEVHERALGFAGRAIQPGASVEGDVVYDIPLTEIERVTREGVLYVANFGPQARRSELGQFRIYME